jgi:hypothetical protein
MYKLEYHIYKGKTTQSSALSMTFPELGIHESFFYVLWDQACIPAFQEISDGFSEQFYNIDLTIACYT